MKSIPKDLFKFTLLSPKRVEIWHMIVAYDLS